MSGAQKKTSKEFAAYLKAKYGINKVLRHSDPLIQVPSFHFLKSQVYQFLLQ